MVYIRVLVVSLKLYIAETEDVFKPKMAFLWASCASFSMHVPLVQQDIFGILVF